MTTNNCVEIKDAGNGGIADRLAEPVKQHRDCGFIIPAGILIGLGVGILVDHAGSGFLVGLGFGFLGTGLIPFLRKPLESGGLQPGSIDVTMLLIGAFLTFIGLGLVWAPDAIWPYAIAGFLILAGIWFLVRGYLKIS